MTPEAALKRAIEVAGGKAALAAALPHKKRKGKSPKRITRQAVEQWKRCPPEWVLSVEKLTGVDRAKLAPTLYPPTETGK